MKLLPQISIIFAVCVFGTLVASVVSFPASVTAMLVLLILLLTGAVKTRHIKETCEFLLDNMAFFFIPAAVGIIDEFAAFSSYIVQIVIIAAVSTVLTFAAAAFTVKGVIALQNKFSERGGGNA